MSAETLEQLAAEGFQVEPGLMGEQIIVAGLDVNQLEAGERLQMGNEAVVEVTKLRTGCDRFEAYQGRHPSLAVDRLGVIAKVVAGGSIRPGDRVAVIANV
jgi:MOSC domain-containing protein YiiM